jgi:hypothetical protein
VLVQAVGSSYEHLRDIYVLAPKPVAPNPTKKTYRLIRPATITQDKFLTGVVYQCVKASSYHQKYLGCLVFKDGEFVLGFLSDGTNIGERRTLSFNSEYEFLPAMGYKVVSIEEKTVTETKVVETVVAG